MMKDSLENNSALACNLAAFDPEQMERYQKLAQQFHTSIQETQELPDGYAFRLPAETATVLAVAEFITLERLCCPFFTFGLELEPESGPLWLKVTGPTGVKQLLHAELGLGSQD